MKGRILGIVLVMWMSSTHAQSPCGGVTAVAGYNFMQIDNATVPSPSSDCTILTSDATTQRGCAWDINSTLDMTVSFSYDFKINLGTKDGGADGMAFVIQNDPNGRCACGTSGGSMGAGGITKSLIIEIDTYLNSEDRDDGMAGVACSGGAEPDHLDMWTNGSVNPVGTSCPALPGSRYVTAAIPLKDAALNYNIENGTYHLFRVAWDAATKKITAKVMDLAGLITYGTIVSPAITPTTLFGTNTPFFGFTASTGGLSNEQSFCLPSQFALPIDLISFGATFDNNGKTHVNWTVGNSYNTQYYILESAADAITWETVEKIYTKAGDITHMYNVIDTRPHTPVTYYRLRSVDFNSKADFSYVIIANVNNAGYLGIVKNIYPTPASDALQITFGNDVMNDIPVKTEIYDNLGKLVLEKTFDDATSNNTFNLNLAALSPGFYQLSFIQGETKQVNKLSVVK